MGTEPMKPFRVGDWHALPASNELERRVERIRLEPRVMQVLVCLAQRPGEVVTREEILKTVWDGTFVGDEVLTNAIRELRKALGDEVKSPRYIQTLPKKGYRLVAPVEVSIPRARPSTAWRWVLVPATGLLVGLLWWLWPQAPSVPVPVRVTTFDGQEGGPALSPDGSRIAFVWTGSEGTTDNLYLMSTAGQMPRLLSEGETHAASPTWSPDGERIAFVRFRDGPMGSDLRVVDATGGSERRITLTTAYGPHVDWSPDGEWLAFPDKESEQGPDAIYLYSVETGDKRRLTSPPRELAYTLGDRQPKFSPDGTYLAFKRRLERVRGNNAIYVQGTTDDGEATRVTPEGHRFHSFDWLPDGRGLICSTGEQLFYVSLESKELIPLNFGERAFDVSIEGDRLVYRGGTLDRDIWRVSGPAATSRSAPVAWITSSKQDLIPEYSPDGRRVLFASNRRGEFELWACDAEARNRNCERFGLSGIRAWPSWSPDGERIALAGKPEGREPGLYVLDVEGGVPEPLIRGERLGPPGWSLDGNTLYFTGPEDQLSPELWELSIETRERSRVADVRGIRPMESADGFLYYSKQSSSAPIARIPVAGGEEEIVLDKEPFYYEWDLWEQYLVYILTERDRGFVIEMLDLETRETTVLATLGPGVFTEWGLSISPDGQWVLYSQGDEQLDIMLVEDYLSAIPR